MEPFGDEWEQTAAICETVALAHGAKSATRDVWRPTKRRTPEQSAEQMEAEFRKIEAFMKAQKNVG